MDEYRHGRHGDRRMALAPSSPGGSSEVRRRDGHKLGPIHRLLSGLDLDRYTNLDEMERIQRRAGIARREYDARDAVVPFRFA